MKQAKPLNVQHELCKWLVDSFVKKENINWPREIKLAKKLAKDNPDIDFWRDVLKQFKTKLPSLAYFLTEAGLEVIRKEEAKKNVVLPEKKEYALNEIKTKANQRPQVKKQGLMKFFE